jgi:glycosyltransferase involved in cell wall biosynthesis
MISIVTPTFNCQTSIEKTLTSLTKQSFKNFEVIIIDNCSTDKTLAIARSFTDRLNLKIFSESDRGIADAFNKGIIKAQGEIVAILNSDDYYLSADVLGEIAKNFADKNVEVVHGDMIFQDDVHGTNVRKPLMCSPRVAFPFNHPAFFVRKSVYDKYGIFDLNYRYAMDFEWVCRFFSADKGWLVNIKYLPIGPLVQMNAGGASYNHEDKTLSEVARALQLHGLYNFEAKYHLVMRRSRVALKKYLACIGLSTLVKIWRAYKWKKNEE